MISRGSGLLFLIFLSINIHGYAGGVKLVAGPMQGHVDSVSARIWILSKGASQVEIQLRFKSETHTQKEEVANLYTLQETTAWTADFSGLKPSTSYSIYVILDGKILDSLNTVLTTSPNSTEDFSFLLGSCAMQPPVYAKPFYPGVEDLIFDVMKTDDSAFMLWLGDYLYYRPTEWYSPEKMYKRQVIKRKLNRLNEFHCSMPQYSGWDDHDFGPDNSYGDYILKDTALFLNDLFWPNPKRNDPNKGNYYSFSYNRIDFIMMDQRYYSSPKDASDRTALGSEQMEWFKNELLSSTGDIIFVISPSQFLNEINKDECYMQFPNERDLIIEFIRENKLENVIFLSGDRHHTEMLQKDIGNDIRLYDFTCSPLTSMVRKTKRTPESTNPLRIEGSLITRHNYGRISIRDTGSGRQAFFEVFDSAGQLIWDYKIDKNF